jgi:hypothetical protein
MKEYNRNKINEIIDTDKPVNKKSDRKITKPYLIECRYSGKWGLLSDNGAFIDVSWSEWKLWRAYKTAEDRNNAFNNLLKKKKIETYSYSSTKHHEYRTTDLI